MTLIISMVAVIGLLMLFQPEMSYTNILFGLPITPNLRNSETGRSAVRQYRLAILGGITVAAAILIWGYSSGNKSIALQAGHFLILYRYVVYFVQKRALLPRADTQSQIRQTALIGTPERIPFAVWSATVPPVSFSLVCLWVSSASGGLGAIYPASLRRLELGFIFSVWCLAFVLSVWFGSRRSPERAGMATAAAVFQWVPSLVLAIKALEPVFRVPEWLLAGLLLAAMLIASVLLLRLARRANVPIDPTPVECWKGGLFYVNPGDAALFVQKRDGWGYTPNLARPWNWALLSALPVAMAIFFS